MATYKEEKLPVGELQVDRRVQREALRMSKVEKIVRDYNEDALGVITISRRSDRGLYIIDGWHRVQAVREKTSNTGVVPCHVFEDLTVPEEALMFLDLNFSDRPTAQDRFRVRIQAEDEVAVAVDRLCRSYEWTIGPNAANGVINAVNTVERLYVNSVKLEAEPNLLQTFLLVVTRAWGQNRYAVQASLIEGIGRLIAEHGAALDVSRLVQQLKVFPGGPLTLHAEATQFAALRKGSVSMAVAELVTQQYNRGKKGNKLPEWRHRR